MFRNAMQSDPSYKGVSGKEANWSKLIDRISKLESEVILLRQELTTVRLSKQPTQAVKEVK